MLSIAPYTSQNTKTSISYSFCFTPHVHTIPSYINSFLISHQDRYKTLITLDHYFLGTTHLNYAATTKIVCMTKDKDSLSMYDLSTFCSPILYPTTHRIHSPLVVSPSILSNQTYCRTIPNCNSTIFTCNAVTLFLVSLLPLVLAFPKVFSLSFICH